jgi:hypothetical protein
MVVFSSFRLVVAVVVELAVVEEGVVLQRSSLVLCPFGGEEYCCVDDPFGLNLHQQAAGCWACHRGGWRLSPGFGAGAAVFLYDFEAKHLFGPYHTDSEL